VALARSVGVTVTMRDLLDFDGFYPPVDNAPVVNIVKRARLCR
jgi:hypothetical protein